MMKSFVIILDPISWSFSTIQIHEPTDIRKFIKKLVFMR